jgi:hypothetical protein
LASPTYDVRSIVPHPDVAVLRCRTARSGYRNVYRHHGREDRWVARVKANGCLVRTRGSACPLPHQAALHVVQWYQERYGAEWKEAVARRGLRPGLADVSSIWHSERHGGWLARVWECGRPVELTGRRKRRLARAAFDTAGNAGNAGNVNLRGRDWRTPGRLLVFATEAQAKAAVAVWVRLRWGRRGGGGLWRDAK